MLRQIRLTNFKCFEHLELNCTPLNLYCGMNGMGKSTVIQALLLLRQSFEARELIEGRLLLGGDRVDLGTGRDVLFEDAESNLLKLAIEDSHGRSLDLEFDCTAGADLLDPAIISNSREARSQPTNHPNDRVQISFDFPGRTIGEDLASWQDRPPLGGRLIHVDADRFGPRKIYPLSDVLALRGDFGPSSAYAWNYLSQHWDEPFPTDDPRSGKTGHTLSTAVNHWLKVICPGSQIQLEPVRSADSLVATFAFDRPSDVVSKPHRAINVGFGLSYALPVIVALLSPPGTLCLIENPEAHLHPLGQTKLAELAARAASNGVQVIAESHSDHFLDGIRIAVRDRLIPPRGVAFNYFERHENRSVVTSPQIDPEGRLSHWPKGFFDQHDSNLARLIAPR